MTREATGRSSERNAIRRGAALGLLLVMAATWIPASATSASSAWDEQAFRRDASTLPAAWSKAERWAWEKICKGEVADFDEKLNTGKASGRNTDDRFKDRGRRVGADFLRAMLTSDRLKSAIPREGVRIRGAFFETDVDVRDAVLAHVFEISDSRFAGKAMLNRLQTPTSISFDGSTFEGELWLDSASIGGNLNMTNARFSQGVMLKRAGIDGDIGMSHSHVDGRLNMNGAAVGGSLFMNDGTFNIVNLTTARVDGQVQMSGATLDGRVTMGAIATGGHLLMNGEAEFGEVVLRGARIGGQLSLSRSRFREPLDGQSMTIGQDLQMQGAIFEGAVDLPFIDVGGSVDVSEATVGALNLSGARIDKDLALGAGGRTVRWTNSVDSDGKTSRPAIFLWNTSVGGLVDDADSWPDNLQRVLRDFTYERLTPMGGQEAGFGELRDADWYVKWLEREQSNSFQPYRQLALVLATYGERGEGTRNPDRRAGAESTPAIVVESEAMGTVGSAVDHRLRVRRRRIVGVGMGSPAHRDRLDDRAMEGNTGARWGAARLLVQRRHPAPGSPAQQEARERRNRRTGQVLLPRSPTPRVFPPDRGRGRADSGNRANRTVDALAFRSHPASLIRADPTELTIHCLYDEQQVKSRHHPNRSISLHDQCWGLHFRDPS